MDRAAATAARHRSAAAHRSALPTSTPPRLYHLLFFAFGQRLPTDNLPSRHDDAAALRQDEALPLDLAIQEFVIDSGARSQLPCNRQTIPGSEQCGQCPDSVRSVAHRMLLGTRTSPQSTGSG